MDGRQEGMREGGRKEGRKAGRQAGRQAGRKEGRKEGREKQRGKWKMIGSRHIWDKFLAGQVEAPHNCFFCYLSTFRRKGK